MTYELYINDVLCDMPSDGEITLVYNSPIFADLDAIKSNGSYNIDLPITARNRRAIQNAQRPDTSSRSPYQKLPAKLYCDGIDIFTNGYAVITEITDVISVTLVWGNINLFSKMYDAELRDLKDSFKKLGLEAITWDKEAELSNDPTEDFAFFMADFGMGDPQNVEKLYIQPSISVKSVLRAIEMHTGISFEFPEGYDPRFDGLYLPTVSNNGDIDYQKHGLYADNLVVGDGSIIKFFNYRDYTNNNIPLERWTAQNTDVWSLNVSGVNKINISVWYSTKYFSVVLADSDEPLSSFWIQRSVPGTFEGGVLLYSQKESFRNGATVYFDNINITLDVNDIDYIRFAMSGGSISYNAPLYAYLAIDSDEFELKAKYPTEYPLAANLPDMTCGDFLQNMMNMYGLFAGIADSSSNRIRFITCDQLYYNVEEGNVYGWSRKVLCNEWRDPTMPDAVEYSIDDWAQKNILNYENDKDILDDTSGEILINNKNIDEEREINIDFSAARNKEYPAFLTNKDFKVNVARVPIFEPNGSVANRISCKDRILALRTTNYTDDNGVILETRPYLTFPDTMKFGGRTGIVAKRYASLKKLLTDMKVITVRMKLTPLDLRHLDYTVPVFLDTFGAYFAIYTITVASSGVCECKLIKM